MVSRYPIRLAICVAALAASCGSLQAGAWQEFRRLVPVAQSCVARHPGQFPKLESNLRQYGHRLAEADAMAALNPAMADQLIAKPLGRLKEELSRCDAAEGPAPRTAKRRRRNMR